MILKLKHAPSSASFVAPSALVRPPARRRLTPLCLDVKGGKRRAADWALSFKKWDEHTRDRVNTLMSKFRQADKNGDGRLDKRELKAVLESCGDGTKAFSANWLSEEELNKVLYIYDSDSSGSLTFDEFVMLAEDGMLLDASVQQYQNAFDVIDRENSGVIRLEEVKQLMVSQGLSEASLAQQVFNKYDRNGDGTISFQEFLEMFRDRLLDMRSVQSFSQTNVLEASNDAATEEQQPLAERGKLNVFDASSVMDRVLDNAEASGAFTFVLASLTYCGPCKRMAAALEQIAPEYPDVTFMKFYANTNRDTRILFQKTLKGRACPSFFLYKGRECLTHWSGGDRLELEKQLRDHLPGAMVPVDPVVTKP